jgi:hypothetical protein
MSYLDDLIKCENENSGLDFKVVQYSKDQHESFIKDILSMANADVNGDRYIIIGVKYKNSGDRDIVGIAKEDFVDSAIYQQLVRDNIEPELNIDYFSHELQDKYLSIIKIENCTNKPYMMKKDFKKLNRGDCFIRKGSSQSRMVREDYDRIITKRLSNDNLNDKVKIYFSGYPQDNEITLKTSNIRDLPSERMANKIKQLIEEKKRQYEDGNYVDFATNINNPFLTVPYEKRSIAELEENLRNIKENFRNQDLYEQCELRSHKLNITIINDGNEYIEDAQFHMDINKIEGLIIPEKIHSNPKDTSNLSGSIGNLDFMEYPKIEDKGRYVRIHNSIMLGGLRKWDIKHHIPENAFLKPVRFLFLENLSGNVIQLKCKLYGKNLKYPIEKTLKIKVERS